MEDVMQGAKALGHDSSVPSLNVGLPRDRRA